MSKVYNFREWATRINEQNNQEGLSYKSYSTVMAGATSSKTTSKSAISKFTKIYKVKDSDKISSENALKKEQGGAEYYVGDKTVKGTDYLKIGDVILNGDSGKAVNITISRAKLLKSSIEASGNGIYALARALKNANKLVAGKKLSTSNPDIIIVLNKANPNIFYGSLNTGFQSCLGKWKGSVKGSMVASKAAKPHENNNKPNMAVYRKVAAGDGPMSGDKWAAMKINRDATPNITGVKDINATIRQLAEYNKIDATSFIDKIKDKEIESYEKLKPIIDEFIETFLTAHIERTADRYKKHLDNQAKESGVPSDVFSKFYNAINSWKTEELKKKDDYVNGAHSEAKGLFTPGSFSGSTSRPALKSSGKSIKGQEGKI